MGQVAMSLWNRAEGTLRGCGLKAKRVVSMMCLYVKFCIGQMQARLGRQLDIIVKRAADRITIPTAWLIPSSVLTCQSEVCSALGHFPAMM